MDKRGFTLIELLSVVTLIALISLIVIPNITENVNKRKNEISEVNKKLLTVAADSYIQKNGNKYAYSYEANGSTYCIPVQSLIDDGVLTTPFKNVNGDEIDYSDAVKATYEAAYNGFDYELVSKSDCTEVVNYVSRPVLSDSMIPVIYEDNVWKKADVTSKWYNYSDQKWANAVYVKEQKTDGVANSKSRYEYKDAVAGTEVLESDILVYFVWIPRFRYQLFTNTSQTINIAFESTSTKKSNGMTTGQWLTHPAFTYNNQELSGIWVGKYETSNQDNNLVIKPNQTPWTNIDYNRATNASINMTNQNNIYGLENINTHLTQNNEWAAVAYLTNSIYGINQKIEPSDSTQTGNSTSTTNNMTGIFDMSGVSKEFVTITEENENSLGSALLETKSWYNETNIFTTTENIFLTRGQTSIFNYSSIKANDSTTSFRVTLINKDTASNNDIQIPTVRIVDNVKYYDTKWIGITPIYYNPVTGRSCTNYHVDNSKTGYNGLSGTDNQTSCLKWYAYSEQNGDVNLLLDHDTTAKLAWVTKDDYGSGIPELSTTLGLTYPDNKIVGEDSYGENGNWNKGPITLLKRLKADTDGWGGVASRTDSYTASNNYNSETDIKRYTINYSGYKARIMTAQEISYITENDSWWSESTSSDFYRFDSKTQGSISPTCTTGNRSGCSYGWLYDRSHTSCKDDGCLNNSDVGYSRYWTVSPYASDSGDTWFVNRVNSIFNERIKASSAGLRPVITVSKSSIFGS